MSSFTHLEPFERPAIVMDCGTGFTKMGFAGNLEVLSTFSSCLHEAIPPCQNQNCICVQFRGRERGIGLPRQTRLQDGLTFLC